MDSMWLGCQICRASQSLPNVILTCKEPDISVPTSLSVPLFQISLQTVYFVYVLI